ncbi:MAG: amidohydrolase family protein [Desulfobacteraceae bacterium]|nr:amidohydrolase family protein [Desulfobacteraceae bacterium]MBC2758033.1 amidohydrolase family protein [Desulfobacteraceae bacterium]
MTQKGFYNFRFFDGISDKLQSNRVIRFNGERIAGIDDPWAKKSFPDYEWINLNGLTVLPGLIDAHIHISVPFVFKVTPRALLQMKAQQAKNFHSCIKYGVTTVRDVGAFPKKIIKWRDQINSGKIAGPRILTTTSFITSPDGVPEMAPTLNFFESIIAGGQFVERLNDPEKAAIVANRLIDQGADWIKTQYSEESFLFHGKLTNLSDECFKSLRRTANKRGVRMAMHHMERAGFKKGIQIGVDTMEHCAADLLKREDVDRFVRQNMGIVPTVKVMGDNFETDELLNWLYSDENSDFMSEPMRQSVNEILKLQQTPYPPDDYMKKFYPDIEFFKRSYPNVLKNVEMIRQAGGKIGVGTDTCGTGLSFFGFYYKELEHLIHAGFTNSDALKAATSVNAEIIGMADHVGTIQEGKYADFTIIEGNPLADIKALKNIKAVVKGGKTLISYNMAIQ